MPKPILVMVPTAMILVGLVIPTQFSSAALITDAQIAEQKSVVQASVRDVLYEEVKLLQMMLVQILEDRVNELQ